MEGPDRIRLSSIEPDLLSDEIIELIADSRKFLPHFHIPLQSGCNKVLKAMHRKYTRETWLSRVQKIRSLMPLACIAADVIVGFPGETDEDFRETLQYLEMADISYLHVFSYSKRENTLAAKMDKMVPDRVRKQRSEALHALSVKKKHSFYSAHCGRTVQVLFEADHDDGFMHGFSENYIRVKTAYLPEWVNTVQPVVLKTIGGDGCYLHVKE
jgi:threonylcarbamoyladenosine tRNA methylthiotransferase MtaB